MTFTTKPNGAPKLLARPLGDLAVRVAEVALDRLQRREEALRDLAIRHILGRQLHR